MVIEHSKIYINGHDLVTLISVGILKCYNDANNDNDDYK